MVIICDLIYHRVIKNVISRSNMFINPVSFRLTSSIKRNSFNQDKKISDKQINYQHYASIDNINSYNLSFQASFSQALKSESKLYKQFLNSKDKKILPFLKDTEATPISVFKFLCHATSNEKTSSSVAKELSQNPRKAESIKNFLIEKLGGNESGKRLFMTWYHDENNGYRKAYSDFYNDEIWNKARNMNEIIKYSPNVAPWAFPRKAEEMGVEPILGEVPEVFGSLDTYRTFVSKIKKWNTVQQKKMQGFSLEVNSKIKDTMKAATIINAKQREMIQPFEMQVEDKTFEVKPIIQSFSAKGICMVKEKNSDKNYILKYAPYSVRGNNDFANKFAENQALRPDMPYLDSMVDFYLKENKSPNAPGIEIFDWKTQSVLYEAIEGNDLVIPEKIKDNLYLFTNYSKISDIKKLGLNLSDVHGGNFKENEKGNYVLIDSGHITFSNPFRPLIIGKQITLGNLCGRELCK